MLLASPETWCRDLLCWFGSFTSCFLAQLERMAYKGWSVEQLVKEAASRGLKPEAALEALLLKSDSEKSNFFGPG